jgi:hypothetical protein
MLKTNYGSYKFKYKNLDVIDIVMMTYSWITFIDVPLFVLYVVIYIQTSIIKVVKESDLYTTLSYMRHANTHHRDLIILDINLQ